MSLPRSLAVSALTVLSGLALSVPAVSQMALPSNVQPTCTVPSSTFATWFQTGTPSSGGVVNGADSVNFPTNNTVCDFYTWGAQMFLWLTSPTPSGGLVLDSQTIFNVLPANAASARFLQPNTGSTPYFALRAEKFDEIGELGQAGSNGVLLSQQGSLVYYGVHVNQIYAFFLTGQKNGQIQATVFPRNSQDLSQVIKYASNMFPGVPVLDPQTLVMEFKSSWVDASTVPDKSKFVTMEAVVPKFSHDSSTTWSQAGTETLELALVGLHIVGTVQNHPEFVWITYEHIMNAPDEVYYYQNSSDQTASQPYDASGTFLFQESGAAASPANTECMKVSGTQIVAITNSSTGKPACAGGIVASNTVRTYPWGSAANNQSTAVVSNNTLLLSINHSVRGQLVGSDVRGNYVQTGGIWTSAPSATADAPIPDTNAFSAGDLRGSLQAFNATMETYVQGTSCFNCHKQKANAPDSFQAFELSHIYSQIVPLPTGGR